MERKLNAVGYTLRDKTPIKIQYIYPREQFRVQKEMLSKDLLKKVHIPIPPQITCEGYSEGKSKESGGPKDFVPLDWERKWDANFGNDDFGVNLAANMKIEGKEDKLDIQPLFDTEVSLFGQNIEVLKIEKSGNNLVGTLIGEKVLEQPLTDEVNKTLFEKDIGWQTELSFPIGPINVSGSFGFEGEASVNFSGKIDGSSGEVRGKLSPSLTANAFAELGAGYEIVEVGIGGNLVLIEDEANLEAYLKLQPSPKYFVFSAEAKNTVTLLEGNLYAYAEIDYYVDSKRFEVEFYNFSGFQFDQTLFSINTSVPAEKDHKAWLKIDQVSGIKPYTARNEKLEIEPREFDVIVEIDGRSYTKTLKDYNKDGQYGKILGEYEPLMFEIPLLSFKKVPINIEVIEKYKIGTLDFKNTLDLAQVSGIRLSSVMTQGKEPLAGLSLVKRMKRLGRLVIRATGERSIMELSLS